VHDWDAVKYKCLRYISRSPQCGGVGCGRWQTLQPSPQLHPPYMNGLQFHGTDVYKLATDYKAQELTNRRWGRVRGATVSPYAGRQAGDLLTL